MECPSCDEPVNLTGFEEGDRLDCTECGATLLLSDGMLVLEHDDDEEDEDIVGLDDDVEFEDPED